MRTRSTGPCAILFLLCGAAAGCDTHRDPQYAAAPGDPQRGREALQRYSCGSCHAIPGVAGARGQVGPPLTGIGNRAYLGGVLPNTPENMVVWIRTPQKAEPRTAMPDLGVSEPEARDMTAFLYTLR